MANQIKINGLGTGRISIDSPYNPAFIQRVKTLGGRWSPGERTWTLDERNLESVRAAMRDIYGMDDLPPANLVSVRVTIGDLKSQYGTFGTIDGDRDAVRIFGRVIASATGRDTGARVGDGVAFEQGKPDSGGSAKNWRTIIPGNCVFVVYDVPESAVAQKIGWKDEWGTFEVIRPATIDRAALETEKAALLARLAEIEKLLAE